MTKRFMQMTAAYFIIVLGSSLGRAQDDRLAEIIGRWDVTVTDGKSTYPSWFEVRKSGRRTFVGSYVGQFGSARPIANVEYKDPAMRFAVPPQWEDRTTDVVYEGRLDGDVIRGETTNNSGDTIQWVARRAPDLDSDKAPTWGTTIELFNGRDLTGWKPRDPDKKNGWQALPGALANVEPGNDLMTEDRFTDFKLVAEFRYPPGSNSGIYLRGRYEAQIEDNFGEKADCDRIGGIYGFLTPSINAAKPAREWQTMEIILIGRRISITLNGERVVDRQIIPGITGGALDSNEGEPGPILLQGDHGPVAFRKISLTPLAEPQQ